MVVPQTTLGELTALPDPLAGFKGATSNGMERKDGREGQGRGGKKGEGTVSPPNLKTKLRP